MCPRNYPAAVSETRSPSLANEVFTKSAYQHMTTHFYWCLEDLTGWGMMGGRHLHTNLSSNFGFGHPLDCPGRLFHGVAQ